jgi:hypothetical protein
MTPSSLKYSHKKTCSANKETRVVVKAKVKTEPQQQPQQQPQEQPPQEPPQTVKPITTEENQTNH